ncbi:unnamed protein product, partial [Ectocarpus sp. 13 AM-2016]
KQTAQRSQRETQRPARFYLVVARRRLLSLPLGHCCRCLLEPPRPWGHRPCRAVPSFAPLRSAWLLAFRSFRFDTVPSCLPPCRPPASCYLVRLLSPPRGKRAGVDES